MTDYEKITAAFNQAGLEFKLVRNDDRWKAICITDECQKGGDIQTGQAVEFWFTADGALVSLGVEG